jgi:putative ABC transport system permease protein
MSLSSSSLIRRSLWFHRRTHVGVVFGAALSTALIVGALLVGDSVRYSLKRLALARLGNATHALSAGDRFTSAQLARNLQATLGGEAAAVLLLEGTATRPDGAARANRVQISGVDGHFWTLGGVVEPPGLAENEAVVNAKLAERLRLKPGDSFVVKLESTGEIPGDSPLAQATQPNPLRLIVKAVHGNERFGRFSLRVNQVQPYNIFVARETLESHAGMRDAANILLIETADSRDGAGIREALGEAWALRDAAAELHEMPEQGVVEIRSRRVFLDPPMVEAIGKVCPQAQEITTYFVNAIRSGDAATPYSFVCAPGSPTVEDTLRDDAVLVNEWLAADLAVTSGAQVVIDYFVPGGTGTLQETNRTFTVAGIVPMSGPLGDPTLLPAFPGLAEADSCSEWDPGVAIDLDRIRDKDEAYWKEHRGTPKAFVTRAAAQGMWSNRFGHVTAIRVPAQAAGSTNALAKRILKHLAPSSLGLVFRPVREEALEASGNAVDFGGLFIGLSFFILVAALLLTALLFAFSIQQRTRESALLLAVGYRLGHVRRLLVAEGACLAAAGAALGSPLGMLYNAVVVYALNGVWRGAVETSALVSHVRPATVAAGAIAGAAAAILSILVATRRLAGSPLSELQRGVSASGLFDRGRRWLSPAVAGLCLAGVAGILLSTEPGRGPEAAGAFFGAGALLITGGLALADMLIRKMSARRATGRFSLTVMGLCNNGRRRGRSLSVVGVLACGVFLVVAVGASRYGPLRDATRKDSGTGGYALYGETAIPLSHDLNSEEGRRGYHLDGKLPDDVRFAQLRVREGDDASCLNLNRVVHPRILGVDPVAFACDERFGFADVIEAAGAGCNPWRLLEEDTADGAVPAIADQAVIVWGLGKKVGDEIEYLDERGRPLRLRLVAGLANSLFQGSVLISEEAFRRHFPSASGTQVLLVETGQKDATAVAGELESALLDWGLELTPSAQRLAEFGEVQNTYLGIFLALGGLGLVVGCVGLGIAVMRNAMERRGELAVLRAVGYRRSALFGLMLSEHVALLLMGVLCGAVSACIAVLPSLVSPGANIPYTTIALLIAGIFASGIGWIAVGCHAATRGALLPSLRNE